MFLTGCEQQHIVLIVPVAIDQSFASRDLLLWLMRGYSEAIDQLGLAAIIQLLTSTSRTPAALQSCSGPFQAYWLRSQCLYLLHPPFLGK